MIHSQRLWKELGRSALTTLALSATLLWLAGCNQTPPQNDQQLRQQAAETTEQVKQEAKEAAANARVAAATAERKVDDIASGVREGMHNDKPSPGAAVEIDINSASAGKLSTLPGISAARAQRIVDNRPYGAPHDLVTKGVVSEAEYTRISGNIVAQ
jgi:DNA uptake protein ComE-like DNA-binding protein